MAHTTVPVCVMSRVLAWKPERRQRSESLPAEVDELGKITKRKRQISSENKERVEERDHIAKDKMQEKLEAGQVTERKEYSHEMTEVEVEMKSCCGVETQTEEENGEEVEHATGEENILNELFQLDSYETFKELAAKSWPEEIYERSKFEFTDAISYDDSYDETKQEMEEDEMDFNNNRMLCSIRKIREIAEKYERKKLTITATNGTYAEGLRKMIKCIFHGSDMSITLLKTKQQHSQSEGGEIRMVQQEAERKRYTEEWKTQNRKRPETIIIKPAGGTDIAYADIVAKMKESIDTDEMGVKVHNVRKTARGNIKIVVKVVKDGAVENFRKRTRESLVGMATEIEKRVDETFLVIRDIEVTTTKEQIEKAIEDSIQNDKEGNDTKIHTLNGNRKRGNLVATVSMNKHGAVELLQRRKIIIEWATCRVHELLVPERCSGCWKYGHTRRDCKETRKDMTGICLRCGEKGHYVKQYENAAKCHDCKIEGHIAGRMECEIYRREVWKLKEKRGMRVNTEINQQKETLKEVVLSSDDEKKVHKVHDDDMVETQNPFARSRVLAWKPERRQRSESLPAEVEELGKITKRERQISSEKEERVEERDHIAKGMNKIQKLIVQTDSYV
ncbi:unnamed protein product [Phaedon cochleariae]|uniref:CCHC-type domain-containing protein n=1 Tax=Phaedon cochleariae TaxID=80249 RepID=A0A9N9SDJ7_PHACE|nr:unnamed protein product [Phaedon cochleariae]